MDQIRVLLIGGPADLTAADCIREVASIGESVKVARGNGYEHFRYSGEFRELDGSRLPAFQWFDRTKIAE